MTHLRESVFIYLLKLPSIDLNNKSKSHYQLIKSMSDRENSIKQNEDDEDSFFFEKKS